MNISKRKKTAGANFLLLYKNSGIVFGARSKGNLVAD